MKKIISLLVVAVMLLSATGCGGNNTTSSIVATQGPSVLSSGTSYDTVVVEFEGNTIKIEK